MFLLPGLNQVDFLVAACVLQGKRLEGEGEALVQVAAASLLWDFVIWGMVSDVQSTVSLGSEF